MHRYIILLFLIVLKIAPLHAQSDRLLSVKWEGVSLGTILHDLSDSSGYIFSYSADIPINKRLNYHCYQKTTEKIVKEILGSGFSVTKQDNYLILKAIKSQPLEIVLKVIDKKTHLPIPYVSILSTNYWSSSMTDQDGIVVLTTSNNNLDQSIQIRHINYKDTSILINNNNALINIFLEEKVDTLENIILISKLQKTFWGFLLPKYLKQQSLNLHDFFKKGPAQFSLLPGLSSRGRLQSQSINNVSVNAIGGYSMGTDGVEFGGLFNLSQGSSHALQIGGLTNMVGGSFTGLQIAGLHNNVIDTVRGAQVSLMSNKTEGVLKGIQLSPFYNEARISKGFQIGLVNASDTSYGYAIGLLNFVKSGQFGVHAFTSDFFSAGIGFRTGTKRSFTELVLAYRNRSYDRYAMAGLVLGTDIPFSKKVEVELSIGGYTGLGYQTNSQNSESWLYQYNAMLHFPLFKNCSFLGGLSFYNQHGLYDSYSIASTKSWFGWQGGIVWSYSQSDKQNHRMFDKKDWMLSTSISQGTNLNFNSPVYGFDVQVKRKLDNRVYLQFTQGYSYYGGYDVGYYPNYMDFESNKFHRKNIVRSLIGLSFYPKNQNRFYIGSGLGFLYLHKSSFSYSPYVGWDLSSRFSVEAQLLGTNFGDWVYSTATINLRYNIFR